MLDLLHGAAMLGRSVMSVMANGVALGLIVAVSQIFPWRPRGLAYRVPSRRVTGRLSGHGCCRFSTLPLPREPA
jgi:hypothetical protein